MNLSNIVIDKPWSEFKLVVSNKQLKVQYEEKKFTYSVFCFDGPVCYRCEIIRDIANVTVASSEVLEDLEDILLEFETDYKPFANQKIQEDVQQISGSVDISNFPSVQAVTGAFFPAVQSVTGSVAINSSVLLPVSVSNFPAVQAVTGSVSIVSSSLLPVSVSNFPSVQVVTGTLSVINSFSGAFSDNDIRFQTVAFPPSGSIGIDIFGKITTSNVSFPGVEITQGTYIEQTTNGQRSIRSANAADTAAGTGARQVQITYFDQNLNGPFTETITLNGTTAVNTVNTNICFIETIDVISAGSNRANVGIISLFTGTNATGTAFVTITAGENTTQFLQHYVRPGWTMYVYSYLLGMDADNINQRASMYLAKYNPLVATSPRTPITSGVYTTAGGPTAIDEFGGVPIRIVGPARVYGLLTSTNSTRSFVANIHYIERPNNS